MARLKKDDDLFNDSSMSFGEHLMELRRCLLNAIFWLMGGFLIALIPLGPYPSLSSQGVSYIQRPLRKSLENYYVNQSNERIRKEESYLKEIGYTGNTQEISRKFNMTAEEFWIFPSAQSPLGQTKPDTALLTNQEGNSPIKEGAPITKEAGTPNVKAQTEILPTPQRVVLWKKLESDPRLKSKALNMPESFVIFIKAALILGILIASPGIAYNFWSFVGAGLYPKEKKLVYRFLPLSLLLFIGGFCLAFFVVFEMVLKFLLEFNASMNIDPDPRISEWLNFALLLPVAFGISFQLPLIMFILERVGIFNVEQYKAHWKISIFVIAFLSMIFTPPDPWSMLCLLTVLVGLYFGGIFLCKLFPKGKRFEEESQQPEKDQAET